MGAIEDSVRDMGQGINRIPHIIIGGNKDKKEKANSPFKSWKQNRNQPTTNDNFDEKIEKVKKYGLVIAISLIVIYLVYRIIKIML